MELLIKILAIIGAFILWLFIMFIVSSIGECLKERAHRKKIEYIQKHRFDKPPLAKCYCIDCISWNKETQECCVHPGWYTADNWFCREAYPRDTIDDQ